MKLKLFLLLLITTTVLLDGCSHDPEEREFFEKAWLHPSTRDDH